MWTCLFLILKIFVILFISSILHCHFQYILFIIYSWIHLIFFQFQYTLRLLFTASIISIFMLWYFPSRQNSINSNQKTIYNACTYFLMCRFRIFNIHLHVNLSFFGNIFLVKISTKIEILSKFSAQICLLFSK